MAATPVEVTLELTPRARFDIIDVRERLRAAHGGLLDVYPRHLYHSFHTTAGYLEQSLAARLTREKDTVAPYVEVFRAMFPEGAGYEHDQLDRRKDLTSEERADFAAALKTVLLKFDGLWNEPFPYILVFHQAPTDGRPHPEAHLHAELYPAKRMQGRLKYLAGSELGAGVFTADTIPEEKAAELRAVTVDIHV